MKDIISFTIPTAIRKRVDKLRGEVSRSKYITHAIQAFLNTNRVVETNENSEVLNIHAGPEYAGNSLQDNVKSKSDLAGYYAFIGKPNDTEYNPWTAPEANPSEGNGCDAPRLPGSTIGRTARAHTNRQSILSQPCSADQLSPCAICQCPRPACDSILLS